MRFTYAGHTVPVGPAAARGAYKLRHGFLVPTYPVEGLYIGQGKGHVHGGPWEVTVRVSVEVLDGHPAVTRVTVTPARGVRAGVRRTDLTAVPLLRLAAETAARASLTRHPDRAYVLDTGDDALDEVLRLTKAGTPAALGTGPAPVLTDTAGVSWYRVTVTDPLAEQLHTSPARRRPTAERHAAVAAVYARAVKDGAPPTLAVAEALGTSHKSAERWVTQARRAGYLPPWEGPK